MPYPDYLKENMPTICPKNWVADEAKRNMVHLVVTRMKKRMH
jgi:hypothetical protein